MLVDGGDIATTVFVREFRVARPDSLLYLAAGRAAYAHRRLAHFARLGADDIYFVESGEEVRLIDTLERSCVTRALIAVPSPAPPQEEVDASESVALVGTLLSMLRRDAVPSWSVAQLYRRIGLSARTAERRIGDAKALQLRVRVRGAILERARQLREAGLEWPLIAELLGAPSAAALLMRLKRAAATSLQHEAHS